MTSRGWLLQGSYCQFLVGARYEAGLILTDLSLPWPGIAWVTILTQIITTTIMSYYGNNKMLTRLTKKQVAERKNKDEQMLAQRSKRKEKQNAADDDVFVAGVRRGFRISEEQEVFTAIFAKFQKCSNEKDSTVLLNQMTGFIKRTPKIFFSPQDSVVGHPELILFSAPPSHNVVIRKGDLLSLLTPVSRDGVCYFAELNKALGYDKQYVYAPEITQPAQKMWWLFCMYAEKLGGALVAMRQWVFIPPSSASIIEKYAKSQVGKSAPPSTKGKRILAATWTVNPKSEPRWEQNHWVIEEELPVSEGNSSVLFHPIPPADLPHSDRGRFFAFSTALQMVQNWTMCENGAAPWKVSSACFPYSQKTGYELTSSPRWQVDMFGFDFSTGLPPSVDEWQAVAELGKQQCVLIRFAIESLSRGQVAFKILRGEIPSATDEEFQASYASDPKWKKRYWELLVAEAKKWYDHATVGERLSTVANPVPTRFCLDRNWIVPHLVWTVGPGNVKPVTRAQVKQKKPDRGIYQCPKLLFVTNKRFISDFNMRCENRGYMKNFSFFRGGTDVLFKALVAELGCTEKDVYVTASRVYVRNVSFFFPDVKSMDLTVDPGYEEQFSEFRALNSGLLDRPGHLPRMAQAMAAAMHQCATTEPLLMFDGGYVTKPKHLNPSGGLDTTNQNNYASSETAATLSLHVGVRVPGFDKNADVQRYGVEAITWRFMGDDMLVAVKFRPEEFRASDMFFTALEQFPGNERTLEQEFRRGFDDLHKHYANVAESSNVQIDNFMIHHDWASDYQGPFMFVNALQWTAKTVGRPFKGETLLPFASPSDSTFLGVSIVPARWNDEIHYVPARPLEKILFSTMWPRHRAKKGSNMDFLASVRCVAGAIEASAGYPDTHVVFFNAYSHYVSTLGKDYMQLLEEDPAQLSWLLTRELPDGYEAAVEAVQSLGRFPTYSEIMELVTGVPSTAAAAAHDISDSASYEEYPDVDYSIGGPPATRRLRGQEQVSVSSADPDPYESGLDPDLYQ